MLPKDFFSKELERCKISIGDWSSRYDKMDDEWLNFDEFSRMLEFKYDSTISLEELRIFKNVEVLRLAEFSDDDNNLTPLFNEQVVFAVLKALELKVISSRKIWDNQPPTFRSSLTHLTLKGCGNIKFAFPFCIAKSLQTLEHLEIRDCEVLEQIVEEEEEAKVVVDSTFQNVTVLKLYYLPKLTAFCRGIDTWKLPMLKRLVVKECEKFTSKYLSFHENSLHISKPKSIWLDNKINSDLEELELRNELRWIKWQRRFKTLEIKFDESANIPLGLLQRFEKLEVLQLNRCSYKEVFSCGNDEKHMQITLGSSSASFQNLKVLSLSYCSKLMKLITPSTARSLLQLREMSVEKCDMVIEIVENEGDATTSTAIVFDNLKKVSLRGLESLTCFCSWNYSFNFPSLEELNIGECPNMKTFSQGILKTPKLGKVNYESFNKTKGKWEKIMEVENEGNDLDKTIQGAYKKQDISLELKLWTFKDINSTEIWYDQHPNSFYQNLTHLILSGCGNIKYAFPSSIAKSLHQLQHLKIHNCKVLEEIVRKEEGANEDDKFLFPHVTSLKLENLPEFIAFNHTFEWPMLKELVVKDCDKFMTSKYLSFQENNEEGELNFSEPKSLFLNDKINSDLEKMKLENENISIKWLGQSKALEIYVDTGRNFPLGLLQTFENLKELQLCFYDEYKEIKCLSDLSNLEVLNVCCYGLMIKLITPSTARSLVQLRELRIEYCQMLIEIVENEGDAKTTEIVFDNLKKLSLIELESLTCFCSGNYSFNFPSLEELIIDECPNMKIFSQGILSTPKLFKVNYHKEEKDLKNGGSELNTTIQQEHKKKVDSNLKELTLSGRDITSVWEGEFQESFGKVKTLQLINDEYANIPVQILHKFNSLKKLILRVSSYEDIFSFGEDNEYTGVFTKLKDLELYGLFNLKCIWKEDSRFNSILQNLGYLEVQYCDNLMTLLPSSTSFENLTALRVHNCNGMQTLMSPSTVKSLVRLKKLILVKCEMMIEVLANEGEIEKGEIVFEKLKSLHFYKLESLTCFYSGYYTLKFPFLESLNVIQCFKMKTFSGGGLSMPMLALLNRKDCLESDTDTIIQQLQNDCSQLWKRFPWS